MTARQDEIEVHELALEAQLKDEDFLNQGSGSHFESRVAELVVLIPSLAGLLHLSQKVEQLVEKGFHNLVVVLAEFDGLDAAGLEALSRSRQVVDTWAGTLRISEAKPSVAGTLGSLGGEDAFEIYPTRGEAIDAYRASMNESPLDPGESQDLLAASSDGDDLNNWGWGSGDATDAIDAVGLDIAELHVTESELLKLDSELRRIVNSGKCHVSLRLTFSRPLNNDDVDSLTDARDYLKREGGQLVLVSLPRDVLKSLRLLDLDREFVIVEGGGEAELAHQRAASGSPATAAPVAATAAPVAATAAPVLELELDPISSIEFDSGISLTIDEVPSASNHSAEVARLQAEVHGLRDRLGTTQAERDKANLTLTELQSSLRRNERRVAELEQTQARAERRAREAEESQDQVRADTRRLDGELARLRQELDQAREASQVAQAELSTARSEAIDPSRLQSLEREVSKRDQRIVALQQSLETAQSSEGATLSVRCSELEEEKARILTEAEAEIQRLSSERQVLREELESAGEMIERLGKELELS